MGGVEDADVSEDRRRSEASEDREHAGGRSWGLVFGLAALAVIAAGTLGAVLVGDVAEQQAYGDLPSEQVNATPERVVYATTVQGNPGDTAVADHGRWVGDPLVPTHVYAVPDHEVAAIANGSQPDEAWASEPVPTDPYSGTLGKLRVEIPEQGSVTFAYVYENASDVPVPANATAQAYYLGWAHDKAEDPPREDVPVRIEAWAEPARAAALAVAALAGGLALAAGGLWIRELRAEPPEDAGPMERSLGLVDLAEDYLDHQRTVLWLAGGLLVAGFVVTGELVRTPVTSAAGLAPGWGRWFEVAHVVGWVALAAGWLVLLVRTYREKAAWRDTRENPPLDL